MPLTGIKHIVLVLSGKGGVGKSSVTTQLALALSLRGVSVGVLDIDLTGPSMPRFFGVEADKVTQAEGGLLIPVVVHDSWRQRQRQRRLEKQKQKQGRSMRGNEEEEEEEQNEEEGVTNGKKSSDHDAEGGDEDGGGGGKDAGSGRLGRSGTKGRTPSYGQLLCMSLGFILSSRSTAVIWRGPKKTAMVRQFLMSTLWPSDLDYLLIDTPPGTSDEHISLLETLLQETSNDNNNNNTITISGGESTQQEQQKQGQLAGAIVVTTPQAVSTADVRKELNFCRTTGLRVLGVVENMAGFVCPHCSECSNVFGKGGGQVMAAEFGVPFLGSVPIDPAFGALIEEGKRPVYPAGTVVMGKNVGGDGGSGQASSDGRHDDDGLLVEKYTDCSLYPVFDEIVAKMMEGIEAST